MDDKMLYHHGIKGMKWGVRRFQNKDGSLTSAGKRRYDSDDVSKAKKDYDEAKRKYSNEYVRYNNQTLGGLVYNKKAVDRLQKSAKNLQYSKTDLKDAKIKAKIDGKHKSDRQIRFEEEYLKAGMTKDEAAVAAYKRIRTERIIAATATVAVTAAAAYVAKQQYDNRVDKIIKAGTELQNISTNSNKGVSDAFYSSKNKMDNIKYRGVYGDTLSVERNIFGIPTGKRNPVYETKIGVTKDIRVASRNSATSVLQKMADNDPRFRAELATQLGIASNSAGAPKQKAAYKRAVRALDAGKVNRSVYDALNMNLANHDNGMSQSITNRFYDALKAHGYDAVKDVNDSKLSGYHSKEPLIVFNGDRKATVNKIRELGASEIAKCKNIGYADIFVREMAPVGAIYVGSTLAVETGLDTIAAKQERAKVEKYRTEHPNTELSYKEIARMN